ncbi:MAG: DNA mismatch repair endonuclease MutL [Clostridia bacterium]|nr:DNA mismatch repair endonuclease MutL [Clostridia bacterium]
MAKINVLDSKTYNKIAAGEVVERPFSVVKELVENSIDAGATNIKIEIENGGIDLIKITDDGCGIEKNELPKSILAHATSKLIKIEDLDNMLTLGFRGEALASISSVSKFKITSKTADQENGAYIYTEGGLNTVLEDVPALDGTVIEVKNLFFNVPARQKFLKSVRAEEGEITNIVLRLILGYPDIAFKYIADGKIVYQSFGDGFENALVAVYGAKTVSDCFFIDTIKHGLRIYGYLGKHYFTKGNKSHQSLFVNGRYVINSTVSSAIANAYSAYLMKRQYPFFVLKVDMPREIVDVNVHPTKSDVRFSNNQVVYGSIYSVVSKVLDGSSEVLNIVEDATSYNEIDQKLVVDTVKTEIVNENKNKFFDNIVFSDTKSSDDSDNFSVSRNLDKAEKTRKEKDKKYDDIFAENKAYLEALEKKKQSAQEKQEIIPQTIVQEKIETEIRLDFLTQALNTYLILESDESLYFIDQHAAHERLIYDKLINSVTNGNLAIQPLLVPFVLNLSPIEFEFLQGKVNTLSKIGIELEEFGINSLRVISVPTLLISMNFEKFFSEIIGDMQDYSNDKLPEYILDKLAQKACKSAIKSGDKLDKSEIDALIKELKNNLGLKCPHGRPVAVKISRTEIDKWFKRII